MNATRPDTAGHFELGTQTSAPLEPLIINACLTGNVPDKANNPNLPVSVEEIIKDAAAVIEAGARVLHIHARDERGTPTWKPEVFAKIFAGIRRHYPDIIITATTSGRVFTDFEQRAAVLELDGAAKPDMASLTLGSLNFPDGASTNSPEMIQRLASRMRERGIVAELEVFEPGMLNYALYLARKELIATPCYVNLILGSLGTSPARTLDLCNLARDVPQNWVWSAAGIGRYQLATCAAAIIMGGHVRIGLEDNLYYDAARNTPASNTVLVERMVRIAAEMGREVASFTQARNRLNLPARGAA